MLSLPIAFTYTPNDAESQKIAKIAQANFLNKKCTCAPDKSVISMKRPPSSSFVKQTINVVVALQPNELGNVKQKIATHFRSLLFKYDASMKGVITSFHNVRLQNGNVGIVHDHSSHMSHQLQTDALAFCPKVGDVLKGKVNSIYATFVTMKIYSLFNVVVGENSLVNYGYEHSSSNDHWVHAGEDYSNTINVGMDLEVVVCKILAYDDYLSVEVKIF